MAALIGIISVIGMLIIWAGRAARSARHISDAAGTLANLPRKLRYQKRVGRSGLDLVESPREAATVLMVAIARLSGDGRVSPGESDAIETGLIEHMDWPAEDAEEFVLNIRWLTREYKQADSVLRPMTNFLQKQISSKEAAELRDMMESIAAVNGPTDSQQDLIRRYSDLMNLS
ncbi:tellurite resistance TerB family protein [Robiginitomaculum antarcticum]|uniref:hypothetical protein n=1 Tax=Robiginitomaculum antarcticum TaxID=437507 RepID=UPI00037A946A|nr:hypothetical protein [Robiginitomaculum antarcticum]